MPSYALPLHTKPGDARIDWSKPLTRGLVGMWLFHEGGGTTVQNLARPFPLTGTTPGWAAGPNGPVVRPTANITGAAALLGVDESFTVLARHQAIGGRGGAVYRNSSNDWSINAYHDSSSQHLDVVTTSAGAAQFTVNGTATFGGGWHTSGYQFEQGVALRLYLDGVANGTTGMSTTTLRGAAGETWSVPQFAGAGDDLDWALLYNRILSVGEIQQLTADPLGSLLVQPRFQIAVPATIPTGGLLAYRPPLHTKPGDARIDWSKPLTRGLLSAWFFAEGGGATVRDLAAPAYTGTLTGAGATWTSTPLGPGLLLDGSTGYVAPAAAPPALTAATWVVGLNATNADDFDGVYVSRDGANAHGTGMIAHSGTLGYMWDGQRWDWTSGPAFTLNRWQQWAVAVDAAQAVVTVSDNVGGSVSATDDFVHGGVTLTTPFELGHDPYSLGGRLVAGTVGYALVYNRALTPAEVAALSADPLGSLLVQQTYAIGAAAAAGGTPQLLRPASDVAAGSWLPTPSSPTTLYDKVDEAAADDSDLIYSTGTAPATLQFGTFSAFDSTGAAGAGKVRYRPRAHPLYTAASFTVELVQGATVIATWTHTTAGSTLPTALTTYEQTLTSGQLAAIDQGQPLRLRVTAG